MALPTGGMTCQTAETATSRQASSQGTATSHCSSSMPLQVHMLAKTKGLRCTTWEKHRQQDHSAGLEHLIWQSHRGPLHKSPQTLEGIAYGCNHARRRQI